MILSRQRLNVRASSSSSPLDKFRSKFRDIVKDVQVRRAKYEKENTDILMNKQVVLKQFFHNELEYFKSLCKDGDGGEVVQKEESEIVHPDVIISDSSMDNK